MTDGENETLEGYTLELSHAGIRQLLAHELRYELLSRGEEADAVVPAMRETLIALIEAGVQIFPRSPCSFILDLNELMQSAQWIVQHKEAYGHRICTRSITKLEARIVHMKDRLSRMVFPTTESDEITTEAIEKQTRYKSWLEHVILQTSKLVIQYRLAIEKREKGEQLNPFELSLAESPLIDFVGLDTTLNPDYVALPQANLTQSQYFDLGTHGHTNGSSTPVATAETIATTSENSQTTQSMQNPTVPSTQSSVTTQLNAHIDSAPSIHTSQSQTSTQPNPIHGLNYVQSVPNNVLNYLSTNMGQPMYQNIYPSISTANPVPQNSIGSNVQMQSNPITTASSAYAVTAAQNCASPHSNPSNTQRQVEFNQNTAYSQPSNISNPQTEINNANHSHVSQYINHNNNGNHKYNLPVNKWTCYFNGEVTSKDPNCLSILDFIKYVERMMRSEEVSPEIVMHRIHYLLRGQAIKWFDTVESSLKTWPEFCTELLDRYAPHNLQRSIEHEISTKKQKFNEKTFDFIDDFVGLMNRSTVLRTEKERIDTILEGIRPEVYRFAKASPTIDNVKSLKTFIKNIWGEKDAKPSRDGFRGNVNALDTENETNHDQSSQLEENPESETDPTVAALEEALEKAKQVKEAARKARLLENKRNGDKKIVPYLTQSNPTKNHTKKTNAISETTQYADDIEKDAPTQDVIVHAVERGTVKANQCFRCGGYNHWVKQCPSKDPVCLRCGKVGKYTNKCSCNEVVEPKAAPISSDYTHNEKEILQNCLQSLSVAVEALSKSNSVKSGEQSNSTEPKSFTDNNNAKSTNPNNYWPTNSISAYNNIFSSTIPTNAELTDLAEFCELTASKENDDVAVIVSNTDPTNVCEVLVQRIYEKQYDGRPHIIVKFGNESIESLVDSGSQCTLIGINHYENSPYLKSLHRHKSDVHFRTADCKRHCSVGKLKVDFTATISGKKVTQTIDTLITPMAIPSPILGIDFQNAMGIKMTQVSVDAIDLSESNVECNANNDPKPSIVEKKHDLTPEMQADLDAVLKLFPFNSDVGPLNATSKIEHKITLRENTPIYQKPYSIPNQYLPSTRTEADRLIYRDIIEPAETGEWNLPVIVVPKPDGRVRLCLDGRLLNKLTVRDRTVQFDIESVLSRIGKAKYISTIDLNDAFLQLPLAKECRHLTRFILPQIGSFRFKRLVPGLINSPAALATLVHRMVKVDEIPELLVYADDFIIITETWERHLEVLKLVAEKFREFELVVSRTKSHFAMAQVKWLGQILNENGLQIDKFKIQAINDYKRPSIVREVRKFLGVCGWYRRFCDNFAEISIPLTNLLKHTNEKFLKWTDKEEDAFNKLKHTFTVAPVLAVPQYDREFIIDASSSTNAISAVLLQQQDDEQIKPIAYMSNKLHGAQSKYEPAEKDMVAVIAACERWRIYIFGKPTTVFTNTPNVLWLNKHNDATGRISRLNMRLQSYDLRFASRPSKSVFNLADALSDQIGENVEIFDENSLIIPGDDLTENQNPDCVKHPIKSQNTKNVKIEASVSNHFNTGDDEVNNKNDKSTLEKTEEHSSENSQLFSKVQKIVDEYEIAQNNSQNVSIKSRNQKRKEKKSLTKSKQSSEQLKVSAISSEKYTHDNSSEITDDTSSLYSIDIPNSDPSENSSSANDDTETNTDGDDMNTDYEDIHTLPYPYPKPKPDNTKMSLHDLADLDYETENDDCKEYRVLATDLNSNPKRFSAGAISYHYNPFIDDYKLKENYIFKHDIEALSVETFSIKDFTKTLCSWYWERYALATSTDQTIESADYIVDENLLYWRSPNVYCVGELPHKLCVPSDFQIAVLRQEHDNLHHPGQYKTYMNVKAKYYFPNMRRFIAKYVAECETCRLCKASNEHTKVPMKGQRQSWLNFQAIGIDFLGPLPKTSKKNTFIIVASCKLSKFVWLRAIPRATTAAVIKFLHEEVFFRYSVPETLICDNGSQFTSSDFKAFCEAFGVKIQYNANYHPQANFVEATNKVIGNSLRTKILSNQEKHTSWDINLYEIAHSINASVHTQTKTTPFEAVLGRPVTLNGADFRQLRLNGISDENHEEVRARRDVISDYIIKNLNKNFEISKRKYNLRTRERTFKVGDVVYIRNYKLSNKSEKYMAKLATKKIKAIVVDKVSDSMYKLKKFNGELIKGTYHANQMFKY